MVEKQLEELGLSKAEIKIYLSLLEFGEQSTSSLSQKTHIHRTYIYDILEKLKDKGLVGELTIDSKKSFKAIEPSRIKDYLEEKIEIANSITRELEKIMHHGSEKASAEAYLGYNGVKTIVNDLINENKDYLVIGTGIPLEKDMPYHVIKSIRELNKKKIRETAILPKGELYKGIRKREHRYLQKSLVDFHTIIIYADKVAFLIWKPTLTQILIKSEEVNRAMRNQFKIMWDVAEKDLKEN